MPNVNIESDIHKLMRIRAAAEGVPLHSVINEALREVLGEPLSRPTLEYVPVGYRRAEDFTASIDDDKIWLIVWRDAVNPTMIWRGPVCIIAVNSSSLIASVGKSTDFVITLDGVIDAVEAFGPTRDDFEKALSGARDAYVAWGNVGARPFPGRHRWTGLT